MTAIPVKNKNKKDVKEVIFYSACIFSLSAAFLDILKCILYETPQKFNSLLLIINLSSVTIAFNLIAFIIPSFLVVFLYRYFSLKSNCLPIIISYGLTLCSFILFSSSDIFVHFYQLSSGSLAKVCLTIISGFICIWIIYFLAVKLTSLNAGTALLFQRIGFTLPFLTFIALIFLWYCTYPGKTLFQNYSIILLICFSLIFIIIFFTGFRKAGAPSFGLKKLISFTTFIIAISLISSMISFYKNISSDSEWTQSSEIKPIILISVDTLRKDALSCYNSKGVSTSHINQLAEEGILFKNAVSPSPWTLPTFASIMTALSPNVHMAKEINSSLPDSLPTLAEHLKSSGYLTAAIGFSPFLRMRNISKGFNEYVFFPKPVEWRSTCFAVRFLGAVLPETFLQFKQRRISGNYLTKLSIDWIKKNRNNNFFLWLHFFAPHISYAPPPEYRPERQPPPGLGYRISSEMMETAIKGKGFLSAEEREWAKELYNGEVKYTDDNVGKFIDALKSMNIYDNSLIIFTSDHGEEFWDHASEGRGVMHGHSLHWELIDVPLIIKMPYSEKNIVRDELVTTESLMPTILDLYGISYDRKHISSNSFIPLLNENPSDFAEKPVFSTAIFQAGEKGHPDDMESLTFKNFKYLLNIKTKEVKLFDLKNDPLELSPISDYPEPIIKEIPETLAGIHSTENELKKYYGVLPENRITLNKSSVDELKSLGYF